MQLNVLVCVLVCRLNYHVTVRSQNYVIISQYWPTCDQAKQLLAGLSGHFLVCLTIVSYLLRQPSHLYRKYYFDREIIQINVINCPLLTKRVLVWVCYSNRTFDRDTRPISPTKSASCGCIWTGWWHCNLDLELFLPIKIKDWPWLWHSADYPKTDKVGDFNCRGFCPVSVNIQFTSRPIEIPLVPC